MFLVDLISCQSGDEIDCCASVLEKVTTKLSDLESNTFEKFKMKQNIGIHEWNKFMQQYFDIEGL